MTFLIDGKPADYENQIKPLLGWLKMAPWTESDGEGKTAAAKAIVEIWDWAEALINKDRPERERFLSEAPKTDETPSALELFRETLKQGGMNRAERDLMKKRVQATEKLQERRTRLSIALLAESKLPIECDEGQGVLVISALMGTKNKSKAQEEFNTFVKDHFHVMPPTQARQLFSGHYLEKDDEGKLIWKPGSFKAVREAVVQWREKRKHSANQANASKPPAPGKKRGRPRKHE